MQKIRFLSGSALKIIAAIAMVVDHVGLLFFPSQNIFRIIGRLSFPIFAFMISEGARYTKNKLRYFLLMFSLATVCQVVYYFFDNGSLYMCILVTFSLSVLLIYSLNWFKRCIFEKDGSIYLKIFSGSLFIGLSLAIYYLTTVLTIDYGFGGIMVPVLASLFDFRKIDAPSVLRKLDTLFVRVICLTVGLIFLAFIGGPNQKYALLATPLLLLYSGSRGKYKLKYFFYIFYPLHLAVLEGIYMLLQAL